MMTRREWLALAAAPGLAAAKPPVIDTHIHLFEPERFPYHPAATYRPEAEPLAPYLAFAGRAGIDHAVIVHPEPYQDDHRYLWYCFENEKPRGFFKGTLLLDPIDPATPGRMAELTKAHPGRIVALRIHATNEPGQPSETSGPIRNRDLRDPRVQEVWKQAAKLGIAIQMHFLPHHAPEIAALCRACPETDVVLDHMGRVGLGTPRDLEQVLRLSEHRRVYFKFSGTAYAEKIDVAMVVRRAHAAFGASRILWGGLGMNAAAHAKAEEEFSRLWAFASPADREQVRGRTAAKLYHFV